MKAIPLLLLFCLSTASAEVLSESSKDLGFGFRQVVRSETNPPGHWEGVGHFVYFYYKDLQLGRCTTYSISPAGTLALYEDGPTADIVLFDVGTETMTIVHEFGGSLATGFEWRKNKASVTLEDGQIIEVKLR